MKKTMIALAALGAMAGVAQAQSSVTLYGLVDMYVGESTTKVSNTGTTVKNGMSLSSGGLSGSRWGVRGAEDLGGGLKATFQLESGVNADDATPNNPTKTFDRTSKLGLSGGFGSFEMGRQYTQLFLLVDSFDAQGTSTFSSAYSAFQDGVLKTDLRWDNSLLYTSPNMEGFTAAAQYAFGEDGAPGVSAGRNIGLSVGYAAGPFAIRGVYETRKAAAAATAKYAGLGASYDFGMVKVLGQFINQKDGTVNGFTENFYNLSVSMPVGSAGTFNVGIGNERQKNAGVKSNKASSYGLEYRHSLSKRTTAYAALGHLTSTAITLPANVVTKKQTYGIGLRHSF